MSEFPNLTVLAHPLIQHKITVLRDRETSTKKFKELVDEIAMLMAYEATKNLLKRKGIRAMTIKIEITATCQTCAKH